MIYVNYVRVRTSPLYLKVGEWDYEGFVDIHPANATIKSVNWTSSDTSVASVNSTYGFVYAVGEGTATITATAIDGSGESDYYTVTVTGNGTGDNTGGNTGGNTGDNTGGNNYIPVTSVEISDSNVELEINGIEELSATVFPENATNTEVVWSSDNDNIATVNPINGIVTGKNPGSTTICASAKGGDAKGYCSVTVRPNVPVDNIEISDEIKGLHIGDTYTITATISPANASNPTVFWSSSNEAVAEVGFTTGIIHAKTEGSTIICAAVADSNIKKYCVILVGDPTDTIVDYVEISDDQLDMFVGETKQLTATIYPIGETNAEIYWYSHDTSIAEIDSSTGEIAAKAEGEVTIRAVAMKDTVKQATCRIKVKTPYGYPTTTRNMTQEYIVTSNYEHLGIDIGAVQGTPVYAFCDGVISFTRNFPGKTNDGTSMDSMGNCIAINHINPDKSIVSGEYARSIYMHLRDNPTDTNGIAEGSEVKKGQIIGYVGNTGYSTAAHLHFGLAVGNLPSMQPGVKNWISINNNLPMVNPCMYLPEYN